MRNRKVITMLISIISIFIMLTVFLYAVITNSIKYTNKVELDGNIFFVGELFGRDVFGIKNSNKIFSTKVINVSGNIPDKLLTAHWNRKGYVIALSNGEISMYSSDGTAKSVEFNNPKSPKIIDACVSDIDQDNNSELIVLKACAAREYADEMVVLKMHDQDMGLVEIHSFDCSGLNPWKVQTADVDGDGIVEISLGVYKTSPFHAEMAKRPFIYNWSKDENYMFPKWLGSRLSRPFEDYVFGDIESNGMDQIISIEFMENGKEILASYAWKGFGFERTAESDVFDDIMELKCKGKDIIAKIKDKDATFWGIFELENGTILLKSKSNNYIL
jgi:hypothetical protein